LSDGSVWSREMAGTPSRPMAARRSNLAAHACKIAVFIAGRPSLSHHPMTVPAAVADDLRLSWDHGSLVGEPPPSQSGWCVIGAPRAPMKTSCWLDHILTFHRVRRAVGSGCPADLHGPRTPRVVHIPIAQHNSSRFVGSPKMAERIGPGAARPLLGWRVRPRAQPAGCYR
jgi:hypothetical protein